MINMSSKSTTGLNTANTDGPYSASNVKGNLQLFSAAKASSDGVQVGSVAESLKSASVLEAAEGDDRLVTPSEKTEKRIPVKDGPEGPGVASAQIVAKDDASEFASEQEVALEDESLGEEVSIDDRTMQEMSSSEVGLISKPSPITTVQRVDDARGLQERGDEPDDEKKNAVESAEGREEEGVRR